MTERVVDRLEAVEIEKHQGHRTAVSPRLRQRLEEAVAEQAAVRQVGQLVMVGKMLNALFVGLAFGNILFDGDEMLNPAVAVGDRGNGQRLGIETAVLAAVDQFAGPHPAGQNGFPHALVELRILLPGIEHFAGVATHGFCVSENPVIRVNAGLAHSIVESISVIRMPLATEFSAALKRLRRDSSFWRTSACRMARPSASC
jgi:hypothetical protein